ncbi:MAG: DUF434 domain-containing protein [Deltaproteobacteria bacterium]|nr:DUF434 domain-containing protein [Deltaproteobacteria bacterium]MBW2069801.1 DUF434 domain-containing protein [Deltaproteobacteria bacterium]
MSGFDEEKLRAAALDFLYLMDHGYPRKRSLELVGNRYNMPSSERHLLQRGIFSRQESQRRKSHLLQLRQLRRARLLVDGHNVLITVESALAGRTLVAATDGVIRDVAGLSHRYKPSALTAEAISCIIDILLQQPPLETLFFLDRPLSRSGELAAQLRNSLHRAGLPGDSQAVAVPEHHLFGAQAVVASSDSAVLDRAQQGIDLAGLVVHKLARPVQLVDFSGLLHLE